MTELSAAGVGFSIGEKRILSDISFTARPGGLVGLIGPNGAGKSTLARLLAGLRMPERGEVRLGNRPVHLVPRKERAQQVAYMPQGHGVHWPLDAYQVVALGRLPHLSPLAAVSAEDDAAIMRAMEKADVAAFADRDVTTLSGGERARVMLARALAVDAPVLLVDEPIASLDPYHQIRVMTLLREIAEEGRLVIAVLHDLPLAARFCARLLLMCEGQLVADGAPQEVLARPYLAAAYGIEGVYGVEHGQAYVLPWNCLDGAAEEEERPHAHAQG